ncbi:MAG: O-antigen ligase family protein [Candidatus Omnitrophota bacterium]
MIDIILSLSIILFAAAFFAAFPYAGVIVLIGLSGIERWNIEGFGLSLPLNEWALAAFLLGAMLRKAAGPNEKGDESFLPLLLIAISGFSSCLFSLHSGLAIQEAFRSAGYIGAAYGVALILSHSNRLTWALCAAYAAGILAAFAAIFQLAKFSSDPFPVNGGFSNENYYSAATAFLLPFFLYESKQKQKTWQANGWIIVFYTLLFLALTAKSRSGAAAILLMLLLTYLAGLLDKKYAVWLLPVFIVGVLVFGRGLWGGSLSERTGRWLSNPFFQERLYNGYFALTAFIQHPIFGVGAGGFDDYARWAFPDYALSVSPGFSSPLIILAERGLAGGLAFTWLAVRLAASVSSLSRQTGEGIAHRAMLASLLVMAAASLMNALHTHLFTWCWIGILLQFPQKLAAPFSGKITESPSTKNKIVGQLRD